MFAVSLCPALPSRRRRLLPPAAALAQPQSQPREATALLHSVTLGSARVQLVPHISDEDWQGVCGLGVRHVRPACLRCRAAWAVCEEGGAGGHGRKNHVSMCQRYPPARRPQHDRGGRHEGAEHPKRPWRQHCRILQQQRPALTPAEPHLAPLVVARLGLPEQLLGDGEQHAEVETHASRCAQAKVDDDDSECEHRNECRRRPRQQHAQRRGARDGPRIVRKTA